MEEIKTEEAISTEEKSEMEIVEEREKKLVGVIKSKPVIIFGIILIALVILGVYIRYLPLSDHGGKPGLWDATTNDYTLGPDLDPFLFLRYAKDIISHGSLEKIDTLRYSPLGFDTTKELQMVSYMIVLTYRIINLFGSYSANFAGAFMPVIFFGLTIIAFFLFVREIFLRRDDKKTQIKAGIIASISTLFMVIIPEFVSRTIAGIPEKESIAFFFMFLSFYLFLRAWKSAKLRNAGIFGILAGVSTGLMGLSWGGVSYAYITISLSVLAAFIFNKVHKKEAILYTLWLLSSFLLALLLTSRYSIIGFATSIDTGLCCLVLLIIASHFIIWKTKVNSLLKLERIKLPRNIVSIIIAVIFGLVVITLISPHAIIDKLQFLNSQLIRPVTGRWNTTVAENRQPYFGEWYSGFGKVVFWMFFIGSVWLFRNMLRKIKRKDAWILTSLYVLFFFGLVFSRYAPHPSILDGENFISKFFYFGSALLLVGTFLYYYIKYHKENDGSFENIEFEYLLLFALFVLTLFTARSAVRLIMVLVPIAPIFLGYLITEAGYRMKDSSSRDKKTYWIVFFGVILVLSAHSAYQYYNQIHARAEASVPYYYTLQWQQAMSWVRENTPSEAVFAHWWDYGYWVQSIGNRATVTDGGNAIVWWNYLTGRFVLTGDNQKDALEFLWNHNVSYFLIDSSDMGKYGAFSQIGSDENYDRISQGPISLISEQSQIQETSTGIIRNYNIPAGAGRVALSPIEEDISFDNNGTKINIFKENTGLMGISIETSQEGDSITMSQPIAVFVSQGSKQISVPMRYLYYNGNFKDFGAGIEATAYVIQRVYGSNNKLQIDEMGAMIYLSPRIMRGMLGQVYVLNNPLKKFSSFELVHSQPDYILEQMTAGSSQKLGEFTYYEGLRGPIKIWKINYAGDEKSNPEYLRASAPDYITWTF